MQPVNGGLHHFVQLLVLHGLTQGNAAEGQKCRQGKTPVYLMIEIGRHQAGVILLAQKKRAPR